MSDSEDEKPVDYTGLIIAAVIFPIFAFFDHIGRLDVGLNAGICVGMSMLAVKMRWNLRRHSWFWIVIAIVLAVQMPLIIAIKWPHYWVSKITLLPIGLASLGLSLGAVHLIERFVAKPDPEDEER
jgi:hypothetical protein